VRGEVRSSFLSLARERENVKTTDKQNNFDTFFFLHIKPTKGLRENIYDLKYSLASLLIKIVDEDGEKTINK